jgi:two-component system, cell cycle response regulator
MQSGIDSKALTVLVVSENRSNVRQLSEFLSTVGYTLLQATEPQLALAAVEARAPQILLVDWNVASRDNWELCRLLSERKLPGSLFMFLLTERLDRGQLQEALDAGIDDFLSEPVVYGELLSRLRSAARILEFDRRVRQQERIDPMTGLLNRSAFVGQLRSQWIISGDRAPRAACAVLDIDFFSRIRHAHGAATGNALLSLVAQELDRDRKGWEVLCYLGGDRFCKMIPGANDAAAVEWAERTRQALAGTRFTCCEPATQITVSIGVAGSDAADDAEELLGHATQALQAAKSAGRNCVVRWADAANGEFQPAGLEKLFERTVARDVMKPCTVVLKSDEPISRATELFERTRLEAIPVVDTAGNLLGLCRATQIEAMAESAVSHQIVKDIMTINVKRFGGCDDFATVMKFFTDDPMTLAVVVDSARPIGLLNCDSLLSLSRPMSLGSLNVQSHFSDTSEYLLVPEACPAEGAQTA